VLLPGAAERVQGTSRWRFYKTHTSGEFKLHGLQAGFAFVFAPGFADPDYAAADRTERLVIEDDLHHLAAAEMERAAKAKTLFGGIEDQTRNPLVCAGRRYH
jgi:hypothetical protein